MYNKWLLGGWTSKDYITGFAIPLAAAVAGYSRRPAFGKLLAFRLAPANLLLNLIT